jgi:hypothetical protein
MALGITAHKIKYVSESVPEKEMIGTKKGYVITLKNPNTTGRIKINLGIHTAMLK